MVSRREAIALGLAVPAVCAMGTAHARRYPAVGRVEMLDPALAELIAPDAVVERILDGFVWSEGPVWIGGAAGMLLVSDVRANRILSWSERRGGAIWRDPSGYAGPADPALAEPGTNGLFLDRRGLIVADSGSRALCRVDLRTKAKTVIVDRFEGKRFNSPNDICVSPIDGSIYFTDPAYGLKDGLNSPVREMDYTGIFRVAPDGTVSLFGKFDVPNGIGISPDGRTLIHTDRALGWVAHRLGDDGRSAGQRVFMPRSWLAGGDGLKVDARGNVWMSTCDGLNIVAPDGRRLGVIRADDIISNCEFGGDGHLYMSTNHRITRVKLKGARKLAV